ncbi:cytochrome P450 [Pleurotus eryngii]|uniref:Cytochrome P450 n=1 Tax=Pleurotus eryngii TaxID=5323 RepID=A0A9P5ZSP8_PLEER|nr:cytochrome P450 [Pleurotus eryngii]
MGSQVGIALLAFLLSVVAYAAYWRITKISLSCIRGPITDASLLLGNLPELYQSDAAAADLKWQKTYGDVVRIKGILGEDRLLITDAKALQYIYQTSGYHWPKMWERRELSRLVTGPGLTWADGIDVHKRQRKIMLPGFGTPESRAFLPVFLGTANKLAEKWKDMISTSGTDGSMVVSMTYWLSRATLDAIGEAAFGYQFGGLDDDKNELANAYTTLLDIWLAFIVGHLHYFHLGTPTCMVAPFVPAEERKVTPREGDGENWQQRGKVLDRREDERANGGKGGKDVMMQSNAAENEKGRMSMPEMLAQMRTIMLAGHETTANTLNWTLFELCKQPHIQNKLRAEIWDAEAMLRANGRTQFEVSDFEDMPYMTAVVREALRFHPALHHAYRQAGRDDVLPLSTPLQASNGTVVIELPVPKGLKVVASITGYNRNKLVFGEDADVFNPDRWLRPSDGKQTIVGVYANVMTFAAGVRSCIGWRFALCELHAFIIELISNFEFELTPEAEHIRRHPCLVVAPTIEGREKEGAQLPLRVRIAIKGE